MSDQRQPLRLGFPVKVMGRAGLRTQDTRRWQKNPHLKCSLDLLHPVLDYLDEEDIRMYRLSSDIAPYATHPELPQFHNQVADSDAELRAFGRRARELGIRLSFHPSQYVLLNSPDDALTAKSIWDLSSQADMLDRMELDDEAVLVTHVGGVYGDHEASRARWISGFERCPEHVRRRLVLENDDIRFSAADVLWIHERTGVRLVFDYQHFWCLNPERVDMRSTLERFLATWPDGCRPKIHFSSPRTELREVKVKLTARQRDAARSGTPSAPKGEMLKTPVKAGARIKTVLRAPVWTGHSDFTNPFEFATFMRMAQGLIFDVMLEGKAKDISLLRLRPDLLRFAPDVAARFGITEDDAARLAADEVRLEAGAARDESADVDEGLQDAAA
ncbi:UV DNA damage repair endonuclease UvsE [Erythrobacteraceae bacterium CFH 75059]|uniref:UV DNA damage repair endonuclease UvsE n=1 Tax=Qipengyuania thermophila TaxID=2509361 RepID=UPI001020A50D|nr:UV DNA damage repair endonuclease UvsE [Qipengyuania thermophila]TCD05308.1 UV DNA damage repair endonuclease UvsE [Erythrobacteraceae bacterium CFH 75059]